MGFLLTRRQVSWKIGLSPLSLLTNAVYLFYAPSGGVFLNKKSFLFEKLV